MLILVAVTVNVAMDGELFNQAQIAKTKTNRESEKEQLTSVIIGELDENANFDITEFDETNLPEGWSYTEGVVTTPKGNIFYLDEKGNISETALTNEMLGKVFKAGDGQQNMTLTFETATNLSIDIDGVTEVTYTYDSSSQTGTYSLEELTGSFTHYTILDNDNNNINEVIVTHLPGMDSEQIFLRSAIAGVTPFTGDTYSDGSGNSITFIVDNGRGRMQYVFNNHADSSSYVYYEGHMYDKEGVINSDYTISGDKNTITYKNEMTLTKQQ